MNGDQKSRTYTPLVVAVALWALLSWWLLFLFQFELDYQRTFFARLRTYVRAPVYSPPTAVDYRDNKSVVWIGWSEPDQGFRWSISRRAGILFRLSREKAPLVSGFRFRTVCSISAIPVTIKINDQAIGDVLVNGADLYTLSVQPEILKPGVNSVEFVMPKARQPGNGDLRLLAIGLAEFALEIDSES